MLIAKSVLVSVAFVLIASSVSANAGKSDGKDLRSAVRGKVVSVSTPVGSLPVRYNANGTMSASSSGIGRLTGLASDKGRWWVKGNQLCQRWKTWLKGKTHCVTVRINGTKVHWTSTSGRTGLATISN